MKFVIKEHGLRNETMTSIEDMVKRTVSSYIAADMIPDPFPGSYHIVYVKDCDGDGISNFYKAMYVDDDVEDEDGILDSICSISLSFTRYSEGESQCEE